MSSISMRCPIKNYSTNCEALFHKKNIKQFFKWPRTNRNTNNLKLKQYFQAEKQLGLAVSYLEKVRHLQENKFSSGAAHIHQSQKNLLNTIYLIYEEIPLDLKISREYRNQLPEVEQQELNGCFAESILFAAQALCRGFRIRSLEAHFEELRNLAQQLCAALDALRYNFRSEILKSPNLSYDSLFPVLKDFDVAWVEFERQICFRYFNVGELSSNLINAFPCENQYFLGLMVRTTKHAILNQIIDIDLLSQYDPQVFIALPRLAILAGLSHLSNQFDITDPSFSWFSSYTTELKKIKFQISLLHDHEYNQLEVYLATSNSDLKHSELHQLYVDISGIADSFQSGPRAASLLNTLQISFVNALD